VELVQFALMAGGHLSVPGMLCQPGRKRC